MAKIYHRGNQKPYHEGQTTQWPRKTGTKKTTNDQQNTTQKAKDRSIGPQLEGSGEHKSFHSSLLNNLNQRLK